MVHWTLCEFHVIFKNNNIKGNIEETGHHAGARWAEGRVLGAAQTDPG